MIMLHRLPAACAALALPATAQDVADTIHSGGPILTMPDAIPRTEAVATRDGRILMGSAADLAGLQGNLWRAGNWPISLSFPRIRLQLTPKSWIRFPDCARSRRTG